MDGPKGVIDVHCHIFKFGESYFNPRFFKSWSARYSFLIQGLIGLKEFFNPESADAEKINEKNQNGLADLIENSKLDHAVVLGYDGVYTDGMFDKEKTPFYVDNDCVIALAKRSDKILAGASINPLRKDWKDELDKCIEAGSVLIKWLPNVQGFDPSDRNIVPFYEKLIDNDLVLLTHTGYEWAVDKIDDDYAKLDRLRLPLDMGVRIIGAHCGGGGVLLDKGFEDVRSMVEKYPNLYFDVSGMATVHRRSRLGNAVKDISERLVFGTDFPVPIHRWAFSPELGLREGLRLRNDYFENYMQCLESVGMADFSRGYEILNLKS